MAVLEKILTKWGESSIKDLVVNYDKLGLRASGEFEEALEQRLEIKDSLHKLSIWGVDHTEYMQNGRRANKKKTLKELQAWACWATDEDLDGGGFIAKWARDKGIVGNPFGIAYNIAEKGIQVPNGYNAGGLVSSVFDEKRILALNRSISLFYVDSVTSDIRNLFA